MAHADGPKPRTYESPWSPGRLLAVAALLLAFVWVAHANLHFTAQEIITATLTLGLVAASFVYATIALDSLRHSEESAVQPIVLLDLVRVGPANVGCGIRVANSGRGPARDITFRVKREPAEGAFKISGLGAITHGKQVLANGEDYVISIGQRWQNLQGLEDKAYAIQVSYTSLAGHAYSTMFVLEPDAYDHILTNP